MHGGLSVPGYTLVRRLDDSGGQATVHLGRSVAPPHHEAAIKIYHSALRSTRDRHRFQREVDAMERLAGDPHIIDVYDTGVLQNGQAYLVMRLCSGGSLAHLVNKRGPLSAGAVASIGVTLAESLDRAHRLGVLHRDIKPHNILLADDGSPVLADFGIVALRQSDLAVTATGRWTAAYAAPELFRDLPASVRSDVYGLAATLYTLLAAHPPHHSRYHTPSPAELLDRRSEPPDNVDGVPPAFMAVLVRALSPAPEERYATAGAFAAALRESIPTPPPPPAATEESPPAAPPALPPSPSPPTAAGPWSAPSSSSIADLWPSAAREAEAPPIPTASWQGSAAPEVASVNGSSQPRGRHAAPEEPVFVERKEPTPAQVDDANPAHVDPAHAVGLRPGVQPGLLATALVGIALVGLLGMKLTNPVWMLWWMGLSGLMCLAAAAASRVLAIVGFAAATGLALIIAIKSYDDSPFGSLGWVLAATLVAITAGAWGHSSSAVRLRWFAWRQQVSRRRWWGQASVRPELTSVEALPAARFLRLAEGTCHYAVVCGSAVALVRWASWSSGRYVLTDAEVRKDGQTWAQGLSELERARRGLSIVEESTVDMELRRRVFLAVDTPGELRKRELRGELTVCHTRDLAEALSLWLAEDPYDLDLELLAALLPLAEKG